jgi:hypothetical protein
VIAEVVVSLTDSGWLLVGLLVSTVLPLIVGLVTTRITSGGVKAVLLLLLNAIMGIGADLMNAHSQGTAFDLTNAVFTWLTFFLVGVGMHFGLWKPTGTSGRLQDVGNSAR